jgi:anti-sigma factor RsiW
MKTNRTSCSEVREKLPLYVGSDLDPEGLEAVGRHLELCSECARFMARATGARRVLVASFRAQEVEVEQPGLWPGIRAKLQAEGRIRDGRTETGVTVPRVRRARWLWAFAPLAAAAALLLFLQAGDELSPATLPKAGPRAIPAPELVVTPVSTPPGGTLERIDPADASLAAPYHPRRGNRAAGDGGVSLAGYKRIK